QLAASEPCPVDSALRTAKGATSRGWSANPDPWKTTSLTFPRSTPSGAVPVSRGGSARAEVAPTNIAVNRLARASPIMANLRAKQSDRWRTGMIRTLPDSSSRRLQLCQQFFQGREFDRLNHVMIESRFLGTAAVGLLTPSGCGDDPDALTPRLLSDAAA